MNTQTSTGRWQFGIDFGGTFTDNIEIQCGATRGFRRPGLNRGSAIAIAGQIQINRF